MNEHHKETLLALIHAFEKTMRVVTDLYKAVSAGLFQADKVECIKHMIKKETE